MQIENGDSEQEMGQSNRLKRILTVTDWLGHTATYGYDPAGRLVSLQNFNSTTTAYGYDDANRPVSIENKKADGSVISSYAFSLKPKLPAIGGQLSAHS